MNNGTDHRWAGHHVLITGGSSGIGLALARALAQRGARLSLVARDQTRLNRVAEDETLGPAVVVRSADVADADELSAAVAELVDRQGEITDVIASAGMVRPGYFQELEADVFVRHMAVNYFGVLNTIRLTLPGMIERKSGTITCISSAAGLVGAFGYSAYGPTKYALRGLCEILRMELKPLGIHVAGAYPSDVDTPQLHMEEPLKPPELRAISGVMHPMSADVVASAILRGVQRRQPVIIPGRETRLLCTAARVAPWLWNAFTDRRISSVSKKRNRILAGDA